MINSLIFIHLSTILIIQHKEISQTRHTVYVCKDLTLQAIRVFIKSISL